MASRDRVLRGLVGIALVAPLTALAAGSPWAGFALAALPAAALVSGAMNPYAAGWLATLGRAVMWGAATSLGAVLVSVAATFAGAIVGLVPNTPETPVGYVLILIFAVLAITPLLVPPLAAIGGAWLLTSRWFERQTGADRDRETTAIR